MKNISQERSIYAIQAWNKKGAGKHKDKKWLSKNKPPKKIKEEEYE